MKLFLSSIALCIALFMQPTQASLNGDCTLVLDAAQKQYKDLFPTDPPNQFFDIWCYRAYPGGLLAGITFDGDNPGVYVMGPPFENTPTRVGSLPDVFALLGITENSGGGDIEDALCSNNNSEISGIKTIVEDNFIFITTEKKCVKLPSHQNLCDPPAQIVDNKPVETGISMLSVTKLDSFKIEGVNLPSIPGFPNPLEFIAESFTSNICFENVLEEAAKYDSKMDVCFIITDLVDDLPGVTGDVTMALEATSTSTIVDDCANTDADTIINLVNGGSM